MPAMIKTIVLPGLVALGLGLTLYAQSEVDYAGWMKDLGQTKGKMQKAIAAKNTADVPADAEKIAGIYKKLSAYWEGKAADAVEVSKKGETAANDLAAAAKAGDEAKIASSLQAINGTCGGCHMAHREGSPGSFKIK